MAEDRYVDINKLLVEQFKEQLELQKRLRKQDEDEQLDKKENRRKLRKGGTVIARGQGRLSELIKPTKIY
jgi:hypothetical protein